MLRLALLLLCCAGVNASAQQLVVGAGAQYRTITQALEAATPDDTIVVRAGTYAEPTIVVRTRGVSIIGEGWPTLDGEGQRELINVRANDVTIRGLRFANTGIAHMQDRAALRVIESERCSVDGNRFHAALYAIYLQRSSHCTIQNNEIVGAGLGESNNGNGIHLWYSTYTRVLKNQIRGQRDGIYFEFSRGAVAEDNVSEDNARYGLHFMFSDSCRYARNAFVRNRAGVAVMYSKGITMVDNVFREASGSAA